MFTQQLHHVRFIILAFNQRFIQGDWRETETVQIAMITTKDAIALIANFMFHYNTKEHLLARPTNPRKPLL